MIKIYLLRIDIFESVKTLITFLGTFSKTILKIGFGNSFQTWFSDVSYNDSLFGEMFSLCFFMYICSIYNRSPCSYIFMYTFCIQYPRKQVKTTEQLKNFQEKILVFIISSLLRFSLLFFSFFF